ncbi:MAG: HNH endonuclease [Planctomycetes bacterium]|nr:HNH endonuclease [Planctomycetota bacterium]
MPSVTSRQLVQAILDAIQESGHSGILVSGIRAHPRKFAITTPDGEQVLLWVYAWTLTPGGRPTLPDEYRIQMTTVQSPLETNPIGPTVLIGYEPNLRMFAGFDLSRHRTFTTGSSSVQININTLHQALQDGLAFDRKTNQEIAVGIRPDQMMGYVYTAQHLHRFGRHAATFDLLKKASSLEEIPEADITHLSQNRQRIVQTVRRLSRRSNFRQQVLGAYGNRCAVTRLQLRLVDAAHILPVGAPGSIDEVRNGLALSPTYHRAYDNGLIYLDEKNRMRINADKQHALQELNLIGGLADFKASLGPIHLPPDPHQRPHSQFIRKANRHRQIIVA